jgi:hypothetical protein
VLHVKAGTPEDEDKRRKKKKKFVGFVLEMKLAVSTNVVFISKARQASMLELFVDKELKK